MYTEFVNGEKWLDTAGNVIHAHGGCMLYENGSYYWYGENRTDQNYVSVYCSRDLLNWEFRRNVLTTTSPCREHRVRSNINLTTEEGNKINLERPKVIYNRQTKQFVMWLHMENGINYSDAACASAVSDTPDGEFTYLGSFRPMGFMSRDCTLYQESDGTAYFIYTARDNADLHVYRLSDDYLNIDSLVHRLWQGEYREAPALVRHDHRYYMFSSWCTGWAPNQCRYASAEHIESHWSILHDIGDETTYHTQPAFILTIPSPDGFACFYVADRWNGNDYHDSRYIILPITFLPDGSPALEWTDTFRGIRPVSV